MTSMHKKTTRTTTTRNKTAAVPDLLRVFSRARSMPGLRPVNRDIANPQQRERHQPGHAVLALMNAMSATLEHDKS